MKSQVSETNQISIRGYIKTTRVQIWFGGEWFLLNHVFVCVGIDGTYLL